ncbi:serine hydrolase domain-containing protein [Flavobacterium silvaticum]|uniref:Beta-lactamase family protein n=1 Tax=Flavobacterium silvaticum TaxID=1852020 RepID=A0A972JHC0_9FLAO|nr:serine hydrolase domain-containing protein [Flavobacterium silvaticum]NMH26968.1 beta-lactamase family protein [Flavobacterium silvaticum]
MRIINTSLYISLSVLALLFSSCKKEVPTEGYEPQETYSDTLPHIEPFKLTGPKLAAADMERKRSTIERFVNKNWKNDKETLSFIAVQNGQVIFEKYQGMAQKAKKIEMTKDTPLHIASVSKVLTATAVLILIDEGRLELDQKVNTILKDFPYPDITVKMLLNHRSGLTNYAYYADRKEIWDRHNQLRNQDILDLFVKNQTPLDRPADRSFAYCNTNYAMLALIIEKKTGLKYPEAMKRMIFKPLGMTDTFVMDYDKDRKNVIPSYKANGVEIGMDFLDAVYGDKNIYSTPRDLMKFDMARYNPDYLNPELLKQAYVGYSYEHKGEKNYGLGIRMIEWVTGQHFYFHNGWWHGNTSSYVNLRKEKVMILALSNKFSKKPYMIKKLAPLFGDYPFKKEKEDPLE